MSLVGSQESSGSKPGKLRRNVSHQSQDHVLSIRKSLEHFAFGILALSAILSIATSDQFLSGKQ